MFPRALIVRFVSSLCLLLGQAVPAGAQKLPVVAVEGQPLAANVRRVLQALESLGAPLDAKTATALNQAAEAGNASKIQEILDAHVLFLVSINPEARVKVARGPAPARLQQGGYVPAIVKVVNESTVTEALHIASPQAGPVYSGTTNIAMTRQDQLPLLENQNVQGAKDRFLHLEMFTAQPMTEKLSGLGVEYALAIVYSTEAGKREARLGFDVGQASKDIGFRGEIAVLWDVRPAIPVKLSIKDCDGAATTARLTFHDLAGHVYPPQAKRVAPDLFFQQQIYRRDGDIVLLPPGSLTMTSSRGPEYRLLQRPVVVPAKGTAEIVVPLERWVNPADFGYFSGDHHIHAAGCAHYTNPSEGVLSPDMLLQVKGEGLNVGCILTWAPCYDFQHRFFAPKADKLSEPFTVLKYDMEVSGFGSQALGHVCLLNLKTQIYPGAEGIKGWPTWTTPVLRWAKDQGAVTGYAHSALGLQVNPAAASKRLMQELDQNHDGKLSRQEAGRGLLPEEFAKIDADKDDVLTTTELTASLDRVADLLPNLAIPEMNGVGAQEIFVTVPQGLCDFISSMDTPRLAEWNCWYHLRNCGFALKIAGETDFPCMSGTRVGQGRSYVQLGKIDRIDFGGWCQGLAAGHSYVSDGYAHALQFTVDGKSAGDQVSLEGQGEVEVKAKVAFAARIPEGIAYREEAGPDVRRFVGDTVTLHGPRHPDEEQRSGGTRLVEVVVNGAVVASREVPADGAAHDLRFAIKIDRSSWVALRQFPQLHTNPVNVLVAGKPIRASRKSAQWCAGCIEQLWRAREKAISPAERDLAHRTFLKAIEQYQAIAAEAPEGS